MSFDFTNWSFWILVIAIILISLLDVGINLVAVAVPSVGGAMESLSESLLELIQLLLMVIAYNVGKEG